jgi:arginase family enzyme
MNSPDKIKFFGAALDPLDAENRVHLKRAYISALQSGRNLDPDYKDPYDALCRLDPGLFRGKCEKAGHVPVESWLTTKPAAQDLPLVTPGAYKSFLEDDGCRRCSARVGSFLDGILPAPFVMIGVDHSLTGGVVGRLSQQYGPDNLSLVVLDAHTDLFDFEISYPVQKKMLERTGNPVLLPEMLYNNRFYGCGNFLNYLLDDAVLLPENLYLIGVTDRPDERWVDDNDLEITRYVRAYEAVIEAGVNILSKQELEADPDCLAAFLERIRTPNAYVSIDMDVGAFASTHAVRFLNTVGLAEEAFCRAVEAVRGGLARKGTHLLGFDIMEVDTHFAGFPVTGTHDRSYEMASKVIRLLLPGLVREN